MFAVFVFSGLFVGNQQFCDTTPLYPTEKNADLLDLIIKTSSNPNSYVLDCFCGSGTTLKSAQLLGRNWIGVDQSEQAIKVSAEKIRRYCRQHIRTETNIRTN